MKVNGLVGFGSKRRVASGTIKTLAHLGSDEDDSNDPSNFTGKSFGAAAADRYILVAIGMFAYPTGTHVDGVTIGGVTADEIITRAETGTEDAFISIWAANVPTGTSGTISVNFSGTGYEVKIGWARATGLSSTTPYDTVSDVGNDPAGAISAPAGGIIYGAAYAADSGTITWTNISPFHASGSSRRVRTGGDEFETEQVDLTVTAGCASTPSLAAMVAASW